MQPLIYGGTMLTTTTVELLQIVPARKNVTVVMKVLEMEERSFPAKREGNPPSRRLTVKLQNDEEELLKLVVWGDQINGFTDVVKVEGLYEFSGLFANEVYRPSRFGHLEAEVVFRRESRVKQIQPRYIIRGLQLLDEHLIDPSTSWRIRCCGKVVKAFEHYYERDTGLSGDILVGQSLVMQVVVHGVPGCYLQSFPVGTQVELKGHISQKGSLVELDVQWADVCSSDRLPKRVLPTEVTPTTPSARTSYSSSSALEVNSSVGRLPCTVNNPLTKKYDANAGSVYSSPQPRWSQDPGSATSSARSHSAVTTTNGTPRSSRPYGLDIPGYYEFLGTLTTQFYYDAELEVFIGSVTVTGRRPVVPLRVQSRNLLDAIKAHLRVGSQIVVKGRVYLEGRTLFMVTDEDGGILPEGYEEDTSLEISKAVDIRGSDCKTHRIVCKIVDEFVAENDGADYVGNVVIEDEEMLSIELTLSGVPDGKVHLLCRMAELEVVGRICGDDWELQMRCEWTDVTILSEAKSAESSPRSVAEQNPVTHNSDTSEEPKSPVNLEEDSESTVLVQGPSQAEVVHIGNVDGAGMVVAALAKPIKVEKPDDPAQFTAAGLGCVPPQRKRNPSTRKRQTSVLETVLNNTKQRKSEVVKANDLVA